MTRQGQQEEARRAARCRRRLRELHARGLALEARLRALPAEGKACSVAARRQLDQASRAIEEGKACCASARLQLDQAATASATPSADVGHPEPRQESSGAAVFKALDKVTWTRFDAGVPAGAVGIVQRDSDAAGGVAQQMLPIGV